MKGYIGRRERTQNELYPISTSGDDRTLTLGGNR